MPARAHASSRSEAKSDKLQRYASMRDFAATPEPKAQVARRRSQDLSFVVQKHWASHLHYDFRLELDGVLVSWAVPKGPSLDPKVKRMAVHVEDHPLDYGGFEGDIPPGHYGAGHVIVWDRGTWAPEERDAAAALKAGKLAFTLQGSKLAGAWELIRTGPPAAKGERWLLFKKRDDAARAAADYDVTVALPDSVIGKPITAAKAAKKAAGKAARKASRKAAAAHQDRLPERIEPQLATLVDAPPSGQGWIYETKFDGYRIGARIEGGSVQLITRGGHDWAPKLQPLVQELAALDAGSAWLDGEIIAFGADGKPSFNALQGAFDAARVSAVRFMVFDLLHFEGRDLRGAPLYARRELLRQWLEPHQSDRLQFSAELGRDAARLLDQVCRAGGEGLIAKQREAPYVSGRGTAWLKLKCSSRQEFVIGGYTLRKGSRSQIGGLLLGTYEGKKLRHAGRVGTGWDSATAKSLHTELSALAAVNSPFDDDTTPSTRWREGEPAIVHWVKPQRVAEVRFAEWTPHGHIRHASFIALREDKPARAIGREVAQSAAAPTRVTHPDRVIDKASGLKKIDLVRYYESVAEWMLPHLKNRPVALLRAPAGVAGTHFFQKHEGARGSLGLASVEAKGEDEPLLLVPDAAALAHAAQMNVIEFHTWNATLDRIDHPDRLIFDLDPGARVVWPQMQEAAVLVRALLEELKLQSWLKTSGGKGLHVVVPFKAPAGAISHDTAKALSHAIVQHLAQTLPDRFSAKSGPKNRVGRIFVDYLRNGRGATTVAAFSARARPGLGVSMPVSWASLAQLKGGDHFTVTTARDHLSPQKADPWAAFWKSRQRLTTALRVMGVKAG